MYTYHKLSSLYVNIWVYILQTIKQYIGITCIVQNPFDKAYESILFVYYWYTTKVKPVN